MKWILITGTWRLTDSRVESDVRKAVGEVLSRGDGIVNGGATGVDYFMMAEAIKIDPSCSRIRIIIPARLESYIRDYRTNWCHDPITPKDIDNLETVLKEIKAANPEGFIEMPYDDITQEHYNLRHDEEVAISDEVYAFQVNDSTGAQDTMDKAKAAGLPITLHKKYRI